MPTIRLPNAMRDVITSALGNDLSRRIEKGSAAVDLTYRRPDEAGGREYQVELKSQDRQKTYFTYYGHSNSANWTEPVLLCPAPSQVVKSVSQKVHIGDGVFVLHHIPAKTEEPDKFRVVMTPPDSSAVYLALEAEAREGQSVPMKRADLYPEKG